MKAQARVNNGQKTLTHRHETLFLWDVRKSNPNGDPNGNEPRIDRHTKRCDVMDVCIKRSVRNYIAQKYGVSSLLVTRLGEDASRIVTLTERIEELADQDELVDVVKDALIQIGRNPELIAESLEELSKKLKNLKGKDNKTKNEETDMKELEKEQEVLKLIHKFFEDKTKKNLKPLLENDLLKSSLIPALRKLLCQKFYDLRMFGSVLAIRGGSDLAEIGGPLTGPIQVEIGTSLHRVVQSNKQITSIMAPDMAPPVATPEGEEAEHGGGLFGDTHCIEYGLFATNAIANENAAKSTGLTDEDQQLFLKALWRGTRERHTRSKNGVPRLLIDIEYTKPFHFGDLINAVGLDPKTKNGRPIEEEQYRSIEDFDLNITALTKKLEKHQSIIRKIRFAGNGLIDLETFKAKLPNGLKSKVEEIQDIDYDNNNPERK